MRALSGSISKVVAVAATLTASIAVPALLVQVGALDAVGRELAAPAPSGAQVVVATTQAKPVAVPHRVSPHLPRQQQVVARSRTPAKSQPRATQISNPVSVHTATPAPAQPSTPPPTTTTPTTTTPSPPTTTTPTVPSTTTTPTTTTTPPFTTTTAPTTTTTPTSPVTLPTTTRIGVVTVPPQYGTDVYGDGTYVAVAVTVKADIYAPPPSYDGVTP